METLSWTLCVTPFTLGFNPGWFAVLRMVTVHPNVLVHQFSSGPWLSAVPHPPSQPQQLLFPHTSLFLCGLLPAAKQQQQVQKQFGGGDLQQTASSVPNLFSFGLEVEKPIGHGSFGVVWSVYNSRTGEKAALKRIPNVFQSQLACIRALREIKVLCEFHHENLLSATNTLLIPHPNANDIYVVSDLMESDMHKIIVSPQQLSEDHIKVFLYQILRGVKYLHSAGIIHRDLKPGNILVNGDCKVRICDFGFARAVEPDEKKAMTMEVVTQYYRAPELLAGCLHYGVEIDMWSVGCIFAELLGRRILFEASSPTLQLEMITDLLGTPSKEDTLTIISKPALNHLFSHTKPCNVTSLYNLSCNATHEAVHLLSQMLKFNPSQRLTAVEALCHPYLEDGRLRYHLQLCSCCHNAGNPMRIYCKGELSMGWPSCLHTQ